VDRKELASSIWHACDIMRRDDGTTGVLEYMEQLSWLIFLKIFEDIEKRLEVETLVEDRQYQPIIGQRFRWSSWAKTDWRGEQLIKFIDDELFPYLRSLKGTPEKETISTIFSEISGNRMKSPFNLKDVIAVIDGIDFNNPDDSHIVSQVYEELLLRMGKEGGVAGEFYTPRPIVKLMVKMVNPEIGEKILDPFCGSGGFLAESYNLMKSSKELTREDYEILQRKTFYGQEKKPFPYLLGVMNCILHGLLTPNIIRKNTLEDDIRHIPETERFNVIMTNPPFGGKEGQQIQQNFPIQSQATELLALQYVMKKLKSDGRCGVVLPEGVLAGHDAFAQARQELLLNFNLHSIVSLPSGVFANVTSTGQGPKTNLLFFDRTGPSKEIWYYELVPSKGKKYTKSNPITDIDLEDCFNKWRKRAISENSWMVSMDSIVRKEYALYARNPNKEEEFETNTPEELILDILNKEITIQKKEEELSILIKGFQQAHLAAEEEYEVVKLEDVCEINPSKKEVRELSDEIEVTFVPMNAVSEATGKIENPSVRKLKEVRRGYTYFKEGDVLFAKITPCMENGKSAVARNLANNLGFGSTEFHVLRPKGRVLAEWVFYCVRQKSFREVAARNMTGSVGQQRVREDFLRTVNIALPSIDKQRCLVEYLDKIMEKLEALRKDRGDTQSSLDTMGQGVVKMAFTSKL
jgi:type I restriction enzyme M protein